MATSLSETVQQVIDQHLIPFLFADFNQEDCRKAAWQDFTRDILLPDTLWETLYDSLFTPWLLFDWTANTYNEIGYPADTIALQYLSFHAQPLTPEDKQCILALSDTYYSFYRVMTVKPTLQLYDIFLGTEHSVAPLSDAALVPGGIFYGRLLSLNGQTVSVGHAPYCLPTGFDADLLDLTDSLEADNAGPLTPHDLGTYYADTLRECFFSLLSHGQLARMDEITELLHHD